MDLIRAAHTSAPALTVCCIVSGLLKYKQDVLYYFFSETHEPKSTTTTTTTTTLWSMKAHCKLLGGVCATVWDINDMAHNVCSVEGTSVISE